MGGAQDAGRLPLSRAGVAEGRHGQRVHGPARGTGHVRDRREGPRVRPEGRLPERPEGEARPDGVRPAGALRLRAGRRGEAQEGGPRRRRKGLLRRRAQPRGVHRAGVRWGDELRGRPQGGEGALGRHPACPHRGGQELHVRARAQQADPVHGEARRRGRLEGVYQCGALSRPPEVGPQEAKLLCQLLLCDLIVLPRRKEKQKKKKKKKKKKKEKKKKKKKKKS